MTLAVFLLIAASWAQAPQSAQPTTPSSTPSAPEAANPAAAKQDQAQTSAPANNPSEAKPQTSPTTTPQESTPAKHAHHKKKKAAAVNCDPAPAASANAGTNPTNGGTPSASDPAPSSAGAATAPKNCPPTRIIVRQGGTSEPSIQLAPSTDQASRQRDVVNQLLGTTDSNLKGIAGKQLSNNQQDTVGQIRDYEQQSRKAMTDGDLERARTLAWKAELLSEDLVKPQK